MCGHGKESMVQVWVLNDKDRKEQAYFLFDGYEPETNIVYQFHGCHWHGHTYLKDRTKRQKKRYNDTCKIDWLIEYRIYLVSIWECEEPILKKVRFEKKFTLYPHFKMYDFEAISTALNEHPTDNVTYLSSYIPRSVAVHDTLSKEPVYLVDENAKRLIEQFIKVLTEKQEVIATYVL